MSAPASQVVIGMDPHKRTVTIEVMAADEAVLGGGRYGTDVDGYAAMLAYARRWPGRFWAIEGCSGHRRIRRQPPPTHKQAEQAPQQVADERFAYQRVRPRGRRRVQPGRGVPG
jgi:hypothetical protein